MLHDMSSVKATIVGLSPMTHSHAHSFPRLQSESHDDYDARTWRGKVNYEVPVAPVPGGSRRVALSSDPIDARFVSQDGGEIDARVVLPAHGLHQALAAAARYSKRQIPGQGKATWTAKFEAGIMLMTAPVVYHKDGPYHPNDLDFQLISANADGVRGSGKRVPRRFPLIPIGWQAEVEVMIIDPIITEKIFTEMLELAGLFVGMCQFRPQKGGTNGRFAINNIVWQDKRGFDAAA